MAVRDEFPYDAFLSHSAKDKAVVRPLAERLRADGLKVWFDEWIPSPAGAGEGGRRPGEGRGAEGDSIPAKIEEGHSQFGFRISDSGFAQPGMSANAFGSDWAQLEAGTRGRGNLPFRDPLNQERRFIPLRLDNDGLGCRRFLEIRDPREAKDEILAASYRENA